MRFHIDDRATRYCDIFPEIGKGDINVVVYQPGALAAWHRHQRQADYHFCVQGALKIGICNGPKNEWVDDTWCERWCKFHVLSDRNPCPPLKIEAGLWHGVYNFTTEPAILIYHITNKYDGTDEERATVEEMRWDWKQEVK